MCPWDTVRNKHKLKDLCHPLFSGELCATASISGGMHGEYCGSWSQQLVQCTKWQGSQPLPSMSFLKEDRGGAHALWLIIGCALCGLIIHRQTVCKGPPLCIPIIQSGTKCLFVVPPPFEEPRFSHETFGTVGLSLLSLPYLHKMAGFNSCCFIPTPNNNKKRMKKKKNVWQLVYI